MLFELDSLSWVASCYIYDAMALPPSNPSAFPGHLTAWEAICKTYPQVAEAYPKGLPANTALQPLLHLPAVRPLQFNPMRSKKSQHFILGQKTDHTVLNLKAALSYVSGQEAVVPCDRCIRKCGLWDRCVVAPRSTGRSYDILEGHCANCS